MDLLVAVVAQVRVGVVTWQGLARKIEWEGGFVAAEERIEDLRERTGCWNHSQSVERKETVAAAAAGIAGACTLPAVSAALAEPSAASCIPLVAAVPSSEHGKALSQSDAGSCGRQITHIVRCVLRLHGLLLTPSHVHQGPPSSRHRWLLLRLLCEEIGLGVLVV